LTPARNAHYHDDAKKSCTLKIEYGLGWLSNIYKEEKMTLDTLKAKLDKKKAETKELEKQVKEAEIAEQKKQEQVAKLEVLSTDISEAIRQLLEHAEVTLPIGKQIITTVDGTGLSTSILNQKAAKTRAGNGGAITFEGDQMSWAGLCALKNITRTPSGSAHRDAYNKDRTLHDTIPHQCSIDGKEYPVS